jgi:RHS repeat-associated protein
MPTQLKRKKRLTKSADFSGCDKTPLPERRRRWIRLTDASSPCTPSPVAKRYEYGMWGEPTQTVGTISADFGYAGYYFHAPSGLNLTTYRAYSPSLGRWINRDPIGEVGGVNLYDYVRNNPASYVDPEGTFGFAAAIPLLFIPGVGEGVLIGAGIIGAGALIGTAWGAGQIVGSHLTPVPGTKTQDTPDLYKQCVKNCYRDNPNCASARATCIWKFCWTHLVP